MKNFFGFIFPFLIMESELIDFLDMRIFHGSGLLDLLFKHLEDLIRLLKLKRMLIRRLSTEREPYILKIKSKMTFDISAPE